MKALAKASGTAYLLIFISGFYANFAILESLVDIHNSERTTLNVMNNSFQFRQGLIGFLVMLISDIFLIWSLYKITKPIHKGLSYITSFFRGLHALFFTMALVKLVKVYRITSETTSPEEIQTSVIYLLSNFDTLWTIGLLFFGVHLLLLGFLVAKSNTIPRILGFLLILGALGYAVDGLPKLFFASYGDLKSSFEAIVITTSVIGELSFTTWLLLKGLSRKNDGV